MKNKLLTVLRYSRYIYYRYFLNKAFTNNKLYYKLKLTKCMNIKESFFGYYNLSPQNNNGETLVCVPNKDDLYIYLKNSEKVQKIYSTNAWNWQQGAMLQWSPNKNNTIYLNYYCKNTKKYITNIVNTKSKKIVKTLELPIACIAKDESYALSLNFERLAIMRPDYGYFNNNEVKLPNNNNDGIWKIDIETNRIELIISLNKLKKLNYVSTMDNAEHKVNHIDIAPNGERFMFLHRWKSRGGRYMRLITADKEGKNLYILNGDKMTSHSCWWKSDKIISFCSTQEFDNNYIVFYDKSMLREKLSTKLPSKDGHPSVSPDGRWLITDTYPSYDRNSHLLLYNIENDECFHIGRFFQPLKYKGSYRIDLHPKWNLDGKKIFFESGHSGYRNLYSININAIISNL